MGAERLVTQKMVNNPSPLSRQLDLPCQEIQGVTIVVSSF
jgi:hypothetical protein